MRYITGSNDLGGTSMFAPLEIRAIEIPELNERIAALPAYGRLAQTTRGLTYLKVDDNYIHHTFSLLTHPCQKPNYFIAEEEGVGAHISVFYPEEVVFINGSDLNELHHFSIEGLFFAELNKIRYYALKVAAPSLVALRQRYGLDKKLAINGCLVDMHITVGLAAIA